MENSNNCNKMSYSRFHFPFPPTGNGPYSPFPEQYPPYLLSFTQNFGSIHNQLLSDYAVAYPMLNSSNLELWNFMIRGTSKLASEIGITCVDFISYKEAEIQANAVILNMNNYLAELVNSGVLKPFIADQTNFILSVLEKYRTHTDVSFHLTSYANRMAFRTDVCIEDKVTILGASSVAIYSNYFWDAALRDTANPYHKIVVDSSPANRLKIDWADVIGFVAGAVIGSGGGPAGAIGTGVALGGFFSKVFTDK